MNEHFYNPETIEAFLENALSGHEKASFESAIAKDPLLKNEVTLQSDIIEALKQHRKAELKSRLNNIDVSVAPSYLGVKIAASIVLSGLITFGVYSIFNNNTPIVSEKDALKPSVQIEHNPKTESLSSENEVDNKVFASKTEEIQSNNNNKTPLIEKAKPSAIKKIQKETNTVQIKPEPNVNGAPEVSFSESENFQKDESISLPDNKIAQTTETKGGIDITIDPSTDNKFHYKYYNNKLFLFGNFNANTYEILELNTYKGRQVYLYYEKNYYLLNSNQLQVSPLKKITDKKAIEELNKFNK